MLNKQLELRDVLLLFITILLVINTFLNLQPKRLEADTFRTDDCITTKPTDKPTAYLHVATHQP